MERKRSALGVDALRHALASRDLHGAIQDLAAVRPDLRKRAVEVPYVRVQKPVRWRRHALPGLFIMPPRVCPSLPYI